MLAEIAAHLETFGDVGTRAAGTITLGRMPDASTITHPITSLHESGGLAPERDFGGTAVTREHPRIQVHVRGAIHDRTVAETRIKLVFQHMNSIMGILLGGTLYHHVNALQSPWMDSVDENNRPHWKCNFEIHKVPTP